MAQCPRCGFELYSSGICPVCGASAEGENVHTVPVAKPTGGKAGLPRLFLPIVIVVAVGAAVFLLFGPLNLGSAGKTANSAIAAAQAAAAQAAAVPSGAGQTQVQPGTAGAPALNGTTQANYTAQAPGAADVAAGQGQAAAAALSGQGGSPSAAQVSGGAMSSSAGVTDSPWPEVLATMPTDSKEAYLSWMESHTNETPHFLEQKWARGKILWNNRDITSPALMRAFLYTPREYFVRKFNLKKAYDNTAIPIGYGQTISGPHMVANMTQSLDLQRSDRVLEIGTGSGYQSALLSELCNHVYTIEIVPQIYRETDAIYTKLSARYPEYNNIHRLNADGYYGWAEYAPFQKIIVTAGIDHIPPELLRQLAPNGVMVIPIGPPSGQTVLRIVKKPLPGGGFTFTRSDIYHGTKVIFVPFTSSGGASHSTGAGSGQ